MSEFLGIENSALKFVIAFVLVMALIGLTAWLIRQFGAVRPSGSGARSRQPRLAVLDSATVDARRRLVLIRRDNVEHLLLIGGPTDVVVEENIVRAQPAAAPPRRVEQRMPVEPIEPEYDPSLVPYDEPFYEEPAHTPPPPPVRQAPPRPLAAAPRPAPQPRQAPAPQLQPQPPVSQATRNAQYDMAQRLEAALRQPAPEHPAPRPTVEPRIPAASTTPAPPVRAPEPRFAPPSPAPAPVAAPSAPAPASPAAEPAKSGADVFASLEEEMANLLKPSGKDPS